MFRLVCAPQTPHTRRLERRELRQGRTREGRTNPRTRGERTDRRYDKLAPSMGLICRCTYPGTPFGCTLFENTPLTENGKASPRYTRAPPQFVFDSYTNAPFRSDSNADISYQTVDDNRYSDVNEPVVLFATAIRVKQVTGYSGVIGGIQLGYQDFSTLKKVQTDPMLQRLCCLGKGDPLLCGSRFYGSTSSCDAIMSSACNSLSREEVMATPVCRCYTSLIKAPVCYDKKCLDIITSISSSSFMPIDSTVSSILRRRPSKM